MRYLRQPSRFHLRLGWLDVLVRLVGPTAGDLPRVAEGLQALAPSFEAWIEHAGLSAPPHGALAPGSSKELARMVVSYGLYDERTGALTDAGNVLLATPREPTSPFNWRGARRWVGLWLLMRADGDVALSIVRGWPDEPLGADAVDALVADRLRLLAGAASDDTERSELRSQAERVAGVSTGRRNVVAPRVEPLRELGYLTRLPEINGYSLTDEGRRLRGAWRGEFGPLDCDALLSAGLSRSFLTAEGVDDAAPATFDALVEGIDGAPESLLVTKGEAALAPLVAWIQWSLLDRGQRVWLDDAHALSLARSVRTDPRGSFELKRDEHVDGVNLAWTPRRDAAEGEESAPRPLEAIAETAASPEPLATSLAAPPDPIAFLLDHPAETPALLWLQYVQERTSAFEAGDPDVLRRGGVATRLRQLKALLALPGRHLEKKRKATPGSPSKDDLPAVHCVQRHCAVVPAGFHLSALASEWKAPDRLDGCGVGARVEASQAEAPRESADSRKEVRAFLEIGMMAPFDPKQIVDVFIRRWPAIQERTRSMLADLVAEGIWTLEDLAECMRGAVSRSTSPRVAALAFADALVAAPRRYEYWQVRRAPVDWAARASKVDVFDRSDVTLAEFDGAVGNIRLQMSGIQAFSRGHALRIGAARCDNALAEAAWRTRLDAGPGFVAQCDAVLEEGDEARPDLELAPAPPLDWFNLVEPRTAPPPRGGDGPLADAPRSFARVRLVERRVGETLLTVWTIVEDLARAGRDLPSYEVIAMLSRTLAVVLLRRRLLATHDHAVGALVALAHLDPDHVGLDDRIAHWCSTWIAGRARVRGQSELMRRSTLLAFGERVTGNSEGGALRALWVGSQRAEELKGKSKRPKGEGAALEGESESTPGHSDAPRCESEALQRAITALSPLAARRLADGWTVLDIGLDGRLRDASGLAKVAHTAICDAQAFWSEVYDARNRIVHQGELARLHERDAPIRLEALVPTLLAVVELVIDELSATDSSDLSSAWAKLSLRAIDLSDPKRLEGLTYDGFTALLGVTRLS